MKNINNHNIDNDYNKKKNEKRGETGRKERVGTELRENLIHKQDNK